MFHLCVEEVSEETRAFRMDLWRYNDLRSRQRGRTHINPADPELPRFKQLVEEAWQRVEAHAEFSNLKEGLQSKAKKGRSPMLRSNEQIAESAGIHKSRYHDAYIHLSDFAHGGPLALARLRDYYSEADSIVLVMSYDLKTVVSYLSLGYLDYESLVSPKEDDVPSESRRIMLGSKAKLSEPLT